jgi:hypothetical protein
MRFLTRTSSVEVNPRQQTTKEMTATVQRIPVQNLITD